MPGTNKYTLKIAPGPETVFYWTCDFSKFSKKLNFFPTCKDFHN